VHSPRSDHRRSACAALGLRSLCDLLVHDSCMHGP
jgi:hypothetical protein